ncbi:Succinate-CoA ligase, ADP-forming, beta subunit [Strongyloides ratti]|uniref:Succinate--CoA ligase [ADP-forming] subunit beta, mitochondrial n=1 Tax=Strongyloides ratti TaxID=34506 RepID=A0A090MYY3_STRRB|nr:Succinate-CoA ligase, ADP-forming, beta subunit [Strongyloides ratti]CEF67984.1 Succinate-CoA ligase, ADP-forming, beta subunit [Strongyloides ratti]
MSLNKYCLLKSPKKIFQHFWRNLNLQEHASMSLLKKNGVPVPPFALAKTPEEAYSIAKTLNGNDYVVKAQVLAGGRGKGHFTSGLHGGVHIVFSPEEAQNKASQMIGSKLITKQTTSDGKICNSVLVAERLFTRREYYFSIMLDRHTNGPVLIGSSKGGMNIEEVAAEDPNDIVTLPIKIEEGLTDTLVEKFTKDMKFGDKSLDKAKDIIKKLYEMFMQNDALLIEINPMAEDVNGDIYCMDCKFSVDDNAQFRQKDLFLMQDFEQVDDLEHRASKSNLNYIKLDGNLGCLVNGAGLAMATMDIINLHKGVPANFLDVGGGATTEEVTEALKIITAEGNNVNAILINIFGGIVDCSNIAKAIIASAKDINIPIVCRLQGTNVITAKALIANSGLKIFSCDDLDAAAQLAVKLSTIVQLAKESSLDVSFELHI